MYGKIFDSIFDSTLVSDGGWLPTYIFMSMISLADKDGLVDISPRALFWRLGFREYDSKITYDDFLSAIDFLCAEDPESRSPDQGGRRIVPLSEIDELEGNRGWLIVNYAVYRRKASTTEQPGSSTERVRRWREKRKRYETVCNGGNGIGNGHTDTDTDTDTDINNITPNGVMSGETPDPAPKNAQLRKTAKALLEFLNQKTGRNYQPVDGTLQPIIARLKEGFTEAQCRKVVAKKCREWRGDERMDLYLRPKTLFNRTNFANYVGELGVSNE